MYPRSILRTYGIRATNNILISLSVNIASVGQVLVRMLRGQCVRTPATMSPAIPMMAWLNDSITEKGTALATADGPALV